MEPNPQEDLEDNCKRNPVDLNKVSPYVVESLLVLKRSRQITDFEFFIVYCYLFNGLSLKMLRDRMIRKTKDGFEFTSKQHIHQNIISKVTDMMRKEITIIKELEMEEDVDVGEI